MLNDYSQMTSAKPPAAASYRELEFKSKRCCDGINKTIHLIANEPSLGLYRLQEHVRKSLPKLVNHEDNIKGCEKQLKGLVYDTSAAIEVVKEIAETEETFTRIEELLSKAVRTTVALNLNSRSVT